MSKDIVIKDAGGTTMYELNSEDGGTMGDLMDSIGDGTLKKEDGSLIINKKYTLKPGVYVWELKKAKQGTQQPNGKLRCCFCLHFCIPMLLRIRKFQ
jgi:predicted secreted protein